MPTYPIHVPRHPYGGRDPRKLAKRREWNELAARLEAHINEQFIASGAEAKLFIYDQVALDLGAPRELVRDILFGVDCGHTGLRVRRAGTQE